MSEYSIAQAWIGMVLIGLTYCIIIRRQKAEKCRSEIRAIRDELFDFMWKNKLDFSEPAYVEARQAMNGLLRLTNSLNSVGCLYLMVSAHTKEAAFELLPESELREAVQESLSQSVRAYIQFTFFTGVTGLLMYTLQCGFNVANMLKGLHDRVDRFGKRLTGFRAAIFTYGYEIGSPSLSTAQLAAMGCRSNSQRWR
jgi:hypothetical protein